MCKKNDINIDKKNDIVMVIDNKEIVSIEVATTMFKRMKGLMGKKDIKKALFFNKCNNVHTFFMKEPIDILYLDKNNDIIDLDINLKPYKIGRIILKGTSLIELPFGMIEKFNIQKGSKVSIKCFFK